MIINNRVVLEKDLKGCLCWFWNRNEADKKIGVLADIYTDEYSGQVTFYEVNGGLFDHCEPAKDYDVVFYADKDCSTAGYRRCRREIIETIERYLEEQKKIYKDELPNENLAMEKDNVHVACGQDDDVVESIRKLMELI